MRRIRKLKGITQTKLAEMLDVDQSAVTKWETGVAMPTAEKLPKLAKILDCSIDDLLRDCKGA